MPALRLITTLAHLWSWHETSRSTRYACRGSLAGSAHHLASQLIRCWLGERNLQACGRMTPSCSATLSPSETYAGCLARMSKAMLFAFTVGYATAFAAHESPAALGRFQLFRECQPHLRLPWHKKTSCLGTRKLDSALMTHWPNLERVERQVIAWPG